MREDVDLGLDVSSCFAEAYKPLPYQLVAGQRGYTLGTILNAFSVGMGKTLSSWITHEIIRRENGRCKTVVLCPSTLKKQWKAELSAYTDGRVKARIIDGTPAERRRVYDKFVEVRGTCIIALNYELLLRDAEALAAVFNAADYVIADEASRLKSRTTKTTKLVKKLTKNVPWRCALTATPIEVGIENLYSILEWLDPRMLGTLTLYRGCYTKCIWLKLRNGRKIPKITGYKNLDDLRRRTEPRRFRLRPKDVGVQMPEIRAQVAWVDMGDDQQLAYENARAGALRGLEEDADVNPMVLVGDAIRACLSPSIVGASGLGAKTEYVCDQLVNEAPDEKALVFCESKKYLVGEVLPEFKRAGIKAQIICGDTSLDERRALQRAFNAGTIRVLCGTSAMERGLNLPCGLVYDLDLAWNPSRLIQRAGRARRLKSEHDHVRVINVLTRNTIEDRVLGRVLGRRTLSEAIVGADESDPVGFRPHKEDVASLL